MMKSPLLALALATLSAVPTLAADLPYRKGPPPVYIPPPPLFTWTGFYIGVNGGSVFDQSSNATTVSTRGIAAGHIPSSYRTRDWGFLYGGQIGYNWQMGSIVAGLEADFQGSTLDKTSTNSTAFTTGSYRSQLDYLGTVRARLGYTIFDRALLYATGGLAYGQVRNSLSITDPTGKTFGGTGGTIAGSSSQMRTGFTVGGGAEYAFSPNWSAKVEYLYYDLGKRSLTASNINLPRVGATVNQKENGSIIRAGLNYKFW